MTDKEKEMMAFVVTCLLGMNKGIELSPNDECRLYEILEELEG